MIDFEAKARGLACFDSGCPADRHGGRHCEDCNRLTARITTALREAHAAGMNMAASLAEPYMPSPGRGQYLAEVLEFTSPK